LAVRTIGAAAGEDDVEAPGVAAPLLPPAELPLATGFIAVELEPDDPPPQAAVNSVAAAATAVSWTALRHAEPPRPF
jgi:hypothetical protein